MKRAENSAESRSNVANCLYKNATFVLLYCASSLRLSLTSTTLHIKPRSTGKRFRNLNFQIFASTCTTVNFIVSIKSSYSVSDFSPSYSFCLVSWGFQPGSIHTGGFLTFCRKKIRKTQNSFRFSHLTLC